MIIVLSLISLMVASYKLRIRVTLRSFERKRVAITWAKWCMACEFINWVWGIFYITQSCYIAKVLGPSPSPRPASTRLAKPRPASPSPARPGPAQSSLAWSSPAWPSPAWPSPAWPSPAQPSLAWPSLA